VIAKSRSRPAYWSVAGLACGVRLATPGIPVMALFGVGFGTASAQHSLTLLEATLMSASVFAGASQFVAVEIWNSPMTTAGVAAIGLITATVNLRLFLMSASLRPWLGASPVWQTYPALALLTDPGWLLAVRYRREGGADSAVFLSSGLVLWLTWIAATMVGHWLGAFVADPKRLGLDLVMPCFFIVMLVPLWRGPRSAIPWLIAGAAALLAAEFVAGWWFIIVGAVTGSIIAGLLDDRN
jgi:predicted branched-subunit amino acid permease